MSESPLCSGALVVVYLQQPREQVFGRVLSIDAWGLVVRGLPVDNADDWMRQACSGEEMHYDLSRSFYPIHRVEKVEFDDPAPGIPSLQERFEDRAGHSLLDELGRRFPEDPSSA